MSTATPDRGRFRKTVCDICQQVRWCELDEDGIATCRDCQQILPCIFCECLPCQCEDAE